ncbi:MAG: hypothetical protein NZ742_10870 [Acidobacteria bacterium]|nr:hypothetical protein [Acidobacteriota bacterium]MDW7983100.1 hypothetical protein [Acidobacteriota bacterium]
MRRQLWVLWTGILFSMITISVIFLLVLPLILKNPIRPPGDPFLRWIRWIFIGLVFGLWGLGVWAVRRARRFWSTPGLAEALSAGTGPAAESHPTFRWSLIGWSILEGGIIVDVVYWLLSQDWGNTLPAVLIHGFTFLVSNPLYIVGPVPGGGRR